VAIDSSTNTALRLYGDAEVMSGSIVCGNDSLTGGAGNDYLYGDAATYTAESFSGAIARRQT
jgi:Ca2+-binding RTX toxin-like protein